jgi:hypothetical protein
MDRYDRILSDIRVRTEEGRLQWKFSRIGSFSDLVVNSDRVVRAFVADYALGDHVYTLLFVERINEYHDDFGGAFQRVAFEIYIVDADRDLVLLLRDGLVDRDELAQLAAEIAESNDKAESFFRAFEKFEVA